MAGEVHRICRIQDHLRHDQELQVGRVRAGLDAERRKQRVGRRYERWRGREDVDHGPPPDVQYRPRDPWVGGDIDRALDRAERLSSEVDLLRVHDYALYAHVIEEWIGERGGTDRGDRPHEL